LAYLYFSSTHENTWGAVIIPEMLFVSTLLVAALLAQQAPVPKPFPGAPAPPRPTQPAPQDPVKPAAPPTASPTTPPAKPPATPQPDVNLGVTLYPGAQFLGSYDAGRGQKFYLYGTTASFAAIVAFYREILKRSGDVVFDAPATHVFETGRFREETMAFPPSVTVKDFQSEVSQGYPNPKPGGTPARFPTIIQIVPTAER
jgi:hypothetical protein